MKIARIRQPAVSALAVLLLSGAGIAFAGNAPTAALPTAAPATAPAVAPAAEPAETPGVEPVEPAGEIAGVEEPGDASLPGGGHADDPNDPNADHQFEGVE
ncbi:MAG: hypothetical protein M3R57_10275 [Chloroflexota bacterium]|nr:hypothetical protein [Chloroflexota bacterium]